MSVLRVHLIGISHSSHDVLLAPYCLKAAALNDNALLFNTEIRVDHHAHILANEMEGRCKEIATDIERFNAGLVGFSVYCWNRDAVTRISEMIREAHPDTHIVWGGPEIAASDIQNGLYRDAPVDYLVVGEGETPFIKLLKLLCLNGSLAIPRLAYRAGHSFISGGLDNPTADTLHGLYGYPSPYKLVPFSLLRSPGIEAVVETQRGCNFRCVYCQYNKNFPQIHYRKTCDVLDEIDLIYHSGCKRLRFADGNFFSDISRAIGILNGMVTLGVRMDLMFEAIPNFVDENAAMAVEQYIKSPSLNVPRNTVTIGIGLQTMNAESARAIRRRIPVSKFDNAYKLLNLAGATIKIDLMLGLPNETKASYLGMIEHVIEKMRTGRNFLIVSTLMVLPGTDMEQIASQYGMTIEPGPNHFIYETPTMSRRDMVDCLRISAVIYWLFYNFENRKQYYEVHDRLGISHVELIQRMVNWLLARLDARDNFVQSDFPDAEHWWYFDMANAVQGMDILGEVGKTR